MESTATRWGLLLQPMAPVRTLPLVMCCLLLTPMQLRAHSETSFFTGEVPPDCSFVNWIPLGAYTLQYNSANNSLETDVFFSVVSNGSSVRLGLSSVTAVAEVGSGENTPWPSGGIINSATNSYLGSYNLRGSSVVYDPLEIVPNTPKDLVYRFGVYTSTRNDGRYKLLPGDYTYEVTMSCYVD